TVVLDVAPLPHDNAPKVAPEHCARPDITTRPDPDVPDQYRGIVDEGRWVNHRDHSVDLIRAHPLSSFLVFHQLCPQPFHRTLKGTSRPLPVDLRAGEFDVDQASVAQIPYEPQESGQWDGPVPGYASVRQVQVPGEHV